jgi:hypothetical protein
MVFGCSDCDRLFEQAHLSLYRAVYGMDIQLARKDRLED